jgi:hypothetical protein
MILRRLSKSLAGSNRARRGLASTRVIPITRRIPLGIFLRNQYLDAR